MINLIPLAAKRSVRIEYWVRVLSVWLILWSIALFAAASILLPTYMLVGLQVSSYEATAVEASEEVASYENVSGALAQASQEARIVLDEEAKPLFSEFLLLFERLQGEGVQVTKTMLDRDEKGIGLIALEGIAADRQALASFRDRLLEQESITAVDLPISNLARDKDITFSITVTLVKTNIP
jgi:hypothetical protein